ncbi:hypothetical protein EDD11_007575 [Mortierella claussenii]|nr:hypothetical protein EDD11_007575 [Mortierella claussenii]
MSQQQSHPSTLSSHSNADPVLSPPNQPRRSLSTQLAPDYYGFVNDVSGSTLTPHSSSHANNTSLGSGNGQGNANSNGTSSASGSGSGSRFLDAVTGKSKAQQGRARRQNQPSFSGSTFTNSDDEEIASRNPDGIGNDDSNNEEEREEEVEVSKDHTATPVSQKQRSHNSSALERGQHSSFLGKDNHDPSLDNSSSRSAGSNTNRSTNSANSNSTALASGPRLPPLSKSRVHVPDPSRPAFKLGAPIIDNSRSGASRTPSAQSVVSEPANSSSYLERPTEASALLGGGGHSRPRNPQGDGEQRWTNEGSRRRTPRYNGPNQPSADADELDPDGNTSHDGDSLRRPLRARSLSPTMESRRGRVNFRHYPTSNHSSRRSSKAFHNLRRSSMANINMMREKLRSRRSTYYDDAKEALVKENNGIRIWYHNYTTIDWIHDFVKERVRLRHLRSIGGARGIIKNRADSLKGWVLVLLTGICVVMVTSDGTVSQQRSHGATKRRSGPASGSIPSSNSRDSMQTVLNGSQPKKIAYFGAGSGIPEVKTILGGFVIRGFLGFRTLMIKLIGLPLMVASGLNMGKQGPLVHIACCVGNIVCRKRREILSAAAASGVAVAFGAPIGGVLFSLEEVSYYFPSKTMWRTYFCALTSAVVLKMINPYRVGKTVLFQVTYDRDWHLFEAVPFFFISVFGGVYGALFSQFHMSYSRFRSRTWIGRHPVQEVLVVTLITCAVQWLNPWTRVNLLQLLTNLYSECTADNHLNGMCAIEIDQIYPIFLLLAQVFVMKVILNFITFGVKVPGGIFIPTMVAGAVFGRMVGLGVQWLIAKYPEYQVFQVCEGDSMDCIIPGLYAMIGAAACLSGVTRMTVSLVVIMFELTGAMTYSLPIMMAVMIGKFVGDAFSPDAFFNKLIDLNEHPYLDNKKDYNTFGTAADIADRYLETIDVNAVNDVDSLRRKMEILEASGYSDGGLPIVDGGILVGYIASNELGHALDLAEQKHPECICIFRNRATSNVPATEIITSLSDIEARAGQSSSERDLGLGLGLSHSPTPQSTSQFGKKQTPGSEDPRQEWLLSSSRDDVDYDNDMQGYDQPTRQVPLASHDRNPYSDGNSRNGFARSDSKSFKSTNTQNDHEATSANEGAGDSTHSNGSYRFPNHSDRVHSTGTTDLLRDPAHTMDFTPFTDQAPLSVSLFSSMDLVMELFIKLGIKYVCVVKAGEHYGMIHKKRLLSFLKENDEKQKRYGRGECF